jgi:N6-adenosine-specific RNA methylase IME4
MGTAIVPAQNAELDRLAAQIAWHEQQSLEAFVSAHEHKAAQGRLLIDAKAEAGHGNWMGWVENGLAEALGRLDDPWSQTYINKLMQFSRLWDEHQEQIRTLSTNLPLNIPAAISALQNLFGSDTPDKRPKRPVAPGQPYPLSLPRNDYQIILADPPWQYTSWNSSTKKGRVADDHYPTMKLEKILALDVPGICAKDATLLLWVTLPMLREGLRVIEAWDFTYKTGFLVWGKLSANGRPSVGFGHYTRSNAELCLLATTGRGVRLLEGVAVSNLLLSQRGVHSAKPHGQYDIVSQLFGDVRRVELFARHKEWGWDVWGLQAPEHDSTMALTTAAG